MALAARPSVKLSAVVNVSGGIACSGPFVRDPQCVQLDADVVWNFAQFGIAARMPTLWLYPENDSLFRPGLVSRMHAAFTGTGGRAELVMLPPFGDDGRALAECKKKAGVDCTLAFDNFRPLIEAPP